MITFWRKQNFRASVTNPVAYGLTPFANTPVKTQLDVSSITRIGRRQSFSSSGTLTSSTELRLLFKALPKKQCSIVDRHAENFGSSPDWLACRMIVFAHLAFHTLVAPTSHRAGESTNIRHIRLCLRYRGFSCSSAVARPLTLQLARRLAAANPGRGYPRQSQLHCARLEPLACSSEPMSASPQVFALARRRRRPASRPLRPRFFVDTGAESRLFRKPGMVTVTRECLATNQKLRSQHERHMDGDWPRGPVYGRFLFSRNLEGLALASACFFRHSAPTGPRFMAPFRQYQHALSLLGFGLFVFEFGSSACVHPGLGLYCTSLKGFVPFTLFFAFAFAFVLVILFPRCSSKVHGLRESFQTPGTIAPRYLQKLGLYIRKRLESARVPDFCRSPVHTCERSSRTPLGPPPHHQTCSIAKWYGPPHSETRL